MNIFYSVRWKFTVAFLLVIIATIGSLDFFFTHWMDDYYKTVLRHNLQRECQLVGHLVTPTLDGLSGNSDASAKNIARDLKCRVTIIRPNGRVVGESDHDLTTMVLHNTRPEVVSALRSGAGWDIRRSDTLQKPMLYVAQRIEEHGRTLGIARLAVSLDDVALALQRIHRAFLVATVLAIFIAGLAGTWISGRIAGPIQRMTAVAKRLAKGDLSLRMAVRHKTHDEIDELADTLNTMAAELRARMNELTAERQKLQTILDKTDDGLMFVDHEARVRILNPAAARLLGIEQAQALGKSVLANTFNPEFTELVARVLRTKTSASLEIHLTQPRLTALNVYVKPMENAEGVTGALAVMHDLTAIRRTDDIRREFVANVSHELRTPLATLKAMAETIVLRAGKDLRVAEEYARKIMTEIDRLTALSDDLLDLTQIEAGRRAITREDVPLAEATQQLLAKMQPLALEKDITLSWNIPQALHVTADRDAVEQIFINLVDNAIKYSPHGGRVTVSARRGEQDQIAIAIADTGIGIPAEDVTRIFERFFRVDKARSRASGGTGLGLAIVKHLVESHGGKVTVDSTPGLGSTFTFTLPAHHAP
ncbi:MAG TPA: ATP-binding protein [Armatimonadota bacterium]|jgi:two-component system phosphate regulon sensor histidine kinase PhoR